MIQFHDVAYAPPHAPAVLHSLNLQVARGETLVLLGESGCGKTTTLRLINKLLEPTSGEVRVESKPTREWDAIRLRRGIGYVIQDGGLFPHWNVARNIGTVPRLLGWDEKRIAARVEELLQLVNLDSTQFAHRLPHELSGGQRQRVGVARALAADPPILLLDEPFGALDPLTRDALGREFRALSRRLKKTSVLVTHDVREALRLGDRIALMNAGRIAVLATPQEFVASTDATARAYLQTLENPLESTVEIDRTPQAVNA